MTAQNFDVIIKPSKLSGEISGISSKSVAHRALILASLCEEETEIFINEVSKDISVTIEGLRSLGTGIKISKDSVLVNPSLGKIESADVELYESGSSFRFLIGVAPRLSKKTKMHAHMGLMKRPIIDLVRQYKKNGLVFSDERLPFEISGNLKAAKFFFKGDVSSQYISSTILATSGLRNARIDFDKELQSKGYVDVTIDVLKKFGGEVVEDENSYFVMEKKLKSPKKFEVEMDFSNAAFFLVASALGKSIDITGLNLGSKQRDSEILKILKDFGADVKETKVRSRDRKNLEIDISQIPDLVPILSVLLASGIGTSRLINGKRLRYKESNRLISTRDMINNLGASARIIDDDLEISGMIKGGVVDSFNDHRIAMAASIASVIAQKDIVIKNADAVNKSYPNFFRDFERLGGQYDRK